MKVLRYPNKSRALMGNKRTEKHGGAAAQTAVAQGLPFTGLAVDAQKDIERRLVERGRADVVRAGAVRLETCATLYWRALCAAVDAGDVERMDRYAQRFGWLQASALRAWQAVADDEKQERQTLDAALGKV